MNAAWGEDDVTRPADLWITQFIRRKIEALFRAPLRALRKPTALAR